jgi:FkbM family methyltransferase
MCVNQMQVNRNSKLGCLIIMRQQGFYPSVVIDVGAQTGTADLYQAFPDALHLMIEPVAEHKAALTRLAAMLRNAEVIIAAAAARSGETHLLVSDNKLYSEISDRAEPVSDLTEVRTVPCVAIDDLCRSRALKGPYLAKIDVDGRELDVLEGMSDTLKDTECVIVETVFFGDGKNNFYRVVDYMNTFDLVIYDIVEPLYRQFDKALWQTDTIFVKRTGRFRQFHEYSGR